MEPSSQVNDFIQVIMSNGFLNLITTPTRVTTSSSLDLFMVDIASCVQHTGTITCDISDHYTIFVSCRVQNRAGKADCETFRYQYIISETLNRFRNSVLSADWTPMFNCSHPDECYELFLNVLTVLYRDCFPWKCKVTTRKSRKPWVTPLHIKMTKHKSKLFKHFMFTRDLVDLASFKTYRNSLTNELRRAKQAYQQHLLTKNNNNPKQLWNILNDVFIQANSRNLGLLVIDGVPLHGSSLAEKFNTFFTSFAPSGSSEEALSFITNGIHKSIAFSPIDPTKVFSTLMNLKSTSSVDYDGLQTKPVKYVADVLAPPLAFIFNLCLSVAVFPSRMKDAKVSAIFKAGDRNNLSNYRPISVLPIFSKALEKVVLKRTENFFNKCINKRCSVRFL